MRQIIAAAIFFGFSGVAQAQFQMPDERPRIGQEVTTNKPSLFIAPQTFSPVFGGILTDATTARTLSAADCGQTINFTSGSAITLTTLSTLPVGCHIVVRQGGAGQVTVADGASASHVSASSYTKTRAQYSKIGLSVVVTTVFDIDGDGA
jgi:hypothetical protein